MTSFAQRSIAAIMVAAGTTATCFATVTYRTVALTGTDGAFGPGQGAGVMYSSIGGQQPSINDSGAVAFRGVSGGSNTGMWVRYGVSDGDSNAVVGIVGGAQPGGGVFGATANFNSMSVNNAGQLAYRLGAGDGIFGDNSGNNSNPGRTMLKLDVAPDTGGATYSSVASGMPLFNRSGTTGYIANLTTNTGTPPVVISGANANGAGIWIGTPGAGNQTVALRQNAPVTSLAGDGSVRVGTFQNLSMTMNGNNKFVVTASLQGTVVTGNGAGSNSSAILSNRTTALDVVARVGDAAPDAFGVPSTNLYRNFGTSAVAINDAGHVAFSSSLRDAAGTQTATGALFSDTGAGTMRMLAKVGDALPSIARANGNEFSGVTWGASFGSLVMNAGGTIAMSAAITTPGNPNSNGGIFTIDALGNFTKVMRNRDVAIVGGAPDLSDAFFLSTSSLQLNSVGEMVFAANLTGTGVSVGLGNGSALFGVDVNGAITLLARTGDLYEVSPGDFRVISGIGGIATSGGQDGRVRSLNDLGQVAFELDFNGGTSSGVFVTSVPAPGAGALLGLALFATRRRR